MTVLRISIVLVFFFFSSRRRHTIYWRDWSSDVCSSDLARCRAARPGLARRSRRPRPARPDSRNSGGGERRPARRDRKRVVEGKSVDLGGRRIIKKKKIKSGSCWGPLLLHTRKDCIYYWH